MFNTPYGETAASVSVPSSQNLGQSLRIYAACVCGLAMGLGVLLACAPSLGSDACDAASPILLFDRSGDGLLSLWRCAKAYQEGNWWFVVGALELTYISLKMFAIPATFSLTILAGALLPLPVAQVLTGIGEGVGSSLCYLMSRAIAGPIVERFASEKLAMLRSRAAEEEDHMLLFNFFLRLTPFLPNYFINVASPLVGIPIAPFFAGALLGTQLSLLFLSLTGATLRDVGESGFELGDDFKRRGIMLALTMGVLQCVPLLLIWISKRAKASRSKALDAKSD